jgi:RNA polymerase sigma-70 factor (ECF subfamily)
MVMRTADKLMAEGRAAELLAKPTFDELYSRYFDFAWRSLRRLGVRPSLLEDATQDTFIVLHRRLDTLRADASPKAFLFAIALRVANDYRRSARRKPATSLDDAAVASAGATPFDQTANAQAARLLEGFLDTLDSERRAVFVLVELEGMTAPEVSEALRVNLNTVYTRLRAARQRFVSYLDEREQRDG